MAWRRRCLCSLLAGVVTAALIFLRSQLPRATIELEPGPYREHMYREAREVHFLPDSRQLVTKDWRQPPEEGAEINHYLLRLWDAKTGRPLATLVDGPAAEFMAWSSDPPRVAASMPNGEVKAWDASDGKLLLHKHTDHLVNGFFRGGQLYGIAYDTREVRDIQSGECVGVIDEDLWNACRRWITRRPSGIHCFRQEAAVADLSQEKIVLKLPPLPGHRLRATPDGRFVYSFTNTGVEVWNVRTLAHRSHEFHWPEFSSFTPDCECLVAHNDVDFPRGWRDWLAEAGLPIQIPHAITVVHHGPSQRDVFEQRGGVFGVFSPDGRSLAVLRDNNVIEIWDWPMGVPWNSLLSAMCMAMTFVFGYTHLCSPRLR